MVKLTDTGVESVRTLVERSTELLVAQAARGRLQDGWLLLQDATREALVVLTVAEWQARFPNDLPLPSGREAT